MYIYIYIDVHLRIDMHVSVKIAVVAVVTTQSRIMQRRLAGVDTMASNAGWCSHRSSFHSTTRTSM